MTQGSKGLMNTLFLLSNFNLTPSQGHPVLHGDEECDEGHQAQVISDQGGGILSQIIRAVK